MPVNNKELLKVLEASLAENLVRLTGKNKQEYLDWAKAVAPRVTEYSIRAAAGEAKAVELLRAVEGQASAKFWELVIEDETITANLPGTVVTIVAETAGKLVGSFLKGLIIL